MNPVPETTIGVTPSMGTLSGGKPANAELNPPHGCRLVSLLVDGWQREQLRVLSRDWPSWELTPRQLCDVELLLNGTFSPLEGFLNRAEWESVCKSMRLRNGLLWPILINLDVPEGVAQKVGPGSKLALRDPEGVLLAVLHVDDVWLADRRAEAEAVYGTPSAEHPSVAFLLQNTNSWYLGGRVEGVQLPTH